MQSVTGFMSYRYLTATEEEVQISFGLLMRAYVFLLSLAKSSCRRCPSSFRRGASLTVGLIGTSRCYLRSCTHTGPTRVLKVQIGNFVVETGHHRVI